MGKWIEIFTGKTPPLDPEVSDQLRAMAGWPVEHHHRGAQRWRKHSLTTHRDALGRVTGSVEHFDEEEYEEYSDDWGK